jgi:hypothetical protein
MTPLNPARADFRIIQRILDIYYPNQVAFIPKELNLISRVFNHLKGSWEGIFNGDISQVRKLKFIVKMAVEKGYVSRVVPPDPKKQKRPPTKKSKKRDKAIVEGYKKDE